MLSFPPVPPVGRSVPAASQGNNSNAVMIQSSSAGFANSLADHWRTSSVSQVGHTKLQQSSFGSSSS